MVHINPHKFNSLEDLYKFLMTTNLELHVGMADEPITYSQTESGREEYCFGDKDRWRTYVEIVTYGLYLNNSFFPSSDYQSLKEIGVENFEELKLKKDNVNKLYKCDRLICRLGSAKQNPTMNNQGLIDSFCCRSKSTPWEVPSLVAPA